MQFFFSQFMIQLFLFGCCCYFKSSIVVFQGHDSCNVDKHLFILSFQFYLHIHSTSAFLIAAITITGIAHENVSKVTATQLVVSYPVLTLY